MKKEYIIGGVVAASIVYFIMKGKKAKVQSAQSAGTYLAGDFLQANVAAVSSYVDAINKRTADFQAGKPNAWVQINKPNLRDASGNIQSSQMGGFGTVVSEQNTMYNQLYNEALSISGKKLN